MISDLWLYIKLLYASHENTEIRERIKERSHPRQDKPIKT